MKNLILYVPAIHKGYIHLLEKHPEVDSVYVLGQELIKKLTPYREIRMLDPFYAACMLERVFEQKGFSVIQGEEDIEGIRTSGKEIITLEDEICRNLISKYFPHMHVFFDSIFLKWDSKNVFSKNAVNFNRESGDEFDRKAMSIAGEAALCASDWWRQVGALIVDPEKKYFLLNSWNTHLPSEHTPYIIGDPRDHIEAGTHSELSSAIHAEQLIIATAACEGISLKNMHLYVTVFPCPVCAKLIAKSGIQKVFYAAGHASLDGEAVLKASGIEIIHVI